MSDVRLSFTFSRSNILFLTSCGLLTSFSLVVPTEASISFLVVPFCVAISCSAVFTAAERPPSLPTSSSPVMRSPSSTSVSEASCDLFITDSVAVFAASTRLNTGSSARISFSLLVPICLSRALSEVTLSKPLALLSTICLMALSTAAALVCPALFSLVTVVFSFLSIESRFA